MSLRCEFRCAEDQIADFVWRFHGESTGFVIGVGCGRERFVGFRRFCALWDQCEQRIEVPLQSRSRALFAFIEGLRNMRDPQQRKVKILRPVAFQHELAFGIQTKGFELCKRHQCRSLDNVEILGGYYSEGLGTDGRDMNRDRLLNRSRMAFHFVELSVLALVGEFLVVP